MKPLSFFVGRFDTITQTRMFAVRVCCFGVVILRFLRLLVSLQLASLDGSTVALEQYLSDSVFRCVEQTEHCCGLSLPCITGKKIGVLDRLE
jgi:hypothetical protein